MDLESQLVECGELIGTIDLLPTFAAITKSKLPKKNKIDRVNSLGLLQGKIEAPVRKEFLYYTSRGDIEGIRQVGGNY